MDTDINYLIEAAGRQLKRLENSGEIELGIVLLCALQLFEKEKEKEDKENEL